MTTLVVIAALAAPAAQAGSERHDPWQYRDRDLHAAIDWASKRWKVSASWLHACAHSEGGHGRFIVNGHGAHGWFQFLRGTWTWMSNAAWQAGRGGARPPAKYKRIDSKLGQAYTAAWAFSRGYSYHWYGYGCRR